MLSNDIVLQILTQCAEHDFRSEEVSKFFISQGVEPSVVDEAIQMFCTGAITHKQIIALRHLARTSFEAADKIEAALKLAKRVTPLAVFELRNVIPSDAPWHSVAISVFNVWLQRFDRNAAYTELARPGSCDDKRLEEKTMSDSAQKMFDNIFQCAKDLLRTPRGGWGETMQAYNALLSAIIFWDRQCVRSYMMPDGAASQSEEAAVDAWLAKAKQSGCYIHPGEERGHD
jgi:hypothetical protein